MMGLAFHVSFALILVFLATGCVRTLPFTDVNGRVIPGSVATMESAIIGGIPQSLWFRGDPDATPR